jgi:hypothetical protein
LKLLPAKYLPTAIRPAGVTADFGISVTPASASVIPGSSVGYTVTVTPGSGFSGTVSLRVSGLPGRTSASFNPTSVNTSGSSILTISTRRRTPTGTFTLTVSGISGGLKHSQQMTLTVQ